MHIEHIIPQGDNNADNLCLSCSSCNLSKAKAVEALDPETQSIVPLFNPRNQIWSEHFEWIDKGAKLQGKTAIGRATIIRLKINQDRVVRARINWIAAKNHPPS